MSHWWSCCSEAPEYDCDDSIEDRALCVAGDPPDEVQFTLSGLSDWGGNCDAVCRDYNDTYVLTWAEGATEWPDEDPQTTCQWKFCGDKIACAGGGEWRWFSTRFRIYRHPGLDNKCWPALWIWFGAAYCWEPIYATPWLYHGTAYHSDDAVSSWELNLFSGPGFVDRLCQNMPASITVSVAV